MIDEKKIAKTASLYARETWNHEEEQFVAMCVFKEGTLWAQQEFIKTLWHDASKEPQRGKDIIAISKKGEVYTFHYHALSAIRKSLHDCNIERWCYLSDILPKEGGEQ